MSVRAKFVVNSIKRQAHTVYEHTLPDGRTDYNKPRKTELHTIDMSPVSGHSDPNHENTKFWNATPSGNLTLGTINFEAAKQFLLGREYYLDFTPAD